MKKKITIAVATIALMAAPTVAYASTPGPIDWDTLAANGYAFDCATETIYVAAEDGSVYYYAATPDEVFNYCGVVPTVEWSDEAQSDYVYVEPAPVYEEPEYVEPEESVEPAPAVPPVIVPANRVILIPDWLNQPV